MATEHGGAAHGFRPGGRGLILGKFLPPHAGHVYLVEFARRVVAELTVLVCTLDRDPIPGTLRYRWMRELFPDIRVVHVTDPLPQEPSEHPDFWALWRDAVLARAGGSLDFVFASEAYGHRLAREVGARYLPVDPRREVVPVSGSAIRADPMGCFDFLPPPVRPWFVRRVCLFGPESTGKTTLAARLAARFGTVAAPEYARPLLDGADGRCDAADIPLIARGQVAAEDAMARVARRVLFCDTDPLLTCVWSLVLFGEVPPALRTLARERRYDLHLLCDVDAPWVDDGQRYLKHRRAEFMGHCIAFLEEDARPYVRLSGPWEEREETAARAVGTLLDRPPTSPGASPP